MTIAPRDPFSDVVDQKRKIMPDWYSWFNELTSVANAAGGGGGSGLSPPYIIPADFGVVADGVTDDTAALNAMFASVAGTSAIVLWPKTGFCLTSDTILVGIDNPSGGHTHVSIAGVGTTENCGIKYVGPVSNPGPTEKEILRFSKCTNFFINDFSLRNDAGSKGMTVGISLTGNGLADDSNQTNNFIFMRVNVYRCDIGIRAGGHGACASEGTFIHTGMAENNTGWTAVGLNSLDFQFIQLLGSDNSSFLIDTGSSNGVNVFGGSSTNNQVCFGVQNNATMEIISFRSEDEPKFMTGSGGRVTLQGVAVSNVPSPFIAIDGYYSSLTIKDCIILGSIKLTGNATSYIEMTGNFLDHWDTLHKLPLFVPDNNFTQLLSRVRLMNNMDHNFPPSPILDLVGNMGSRNSPIGAKPFAEPHTTWFPLDRSGVPNFGVEYLALNHVRHLSESTMPGATTNVAAMPGQNLRVSGKFNSSGTLAIAFKRNLTITGIGDPTITATSGIWLPTDAGKALFIAAAADDGSDWYGYITDYISTTQVNVFPGSFTHNQSMPQGVGKTATVGADEPNANYIIAGLVGNIGETFWVDGTTPFTTGGFTVKSSNGSSTAMVTALIVR